MAQRTADDVQREVEQARASLAVTIDQLAERVNPRRLANRAKEQLIARAQTPAGRAVIGAGGALVLLLVIRRSRRRRRARRGQPIR